MSHYLLVFGYYLFDLCIIIFELSYPFINVFMEAVPFIALAYSLWIMLQSIRLFFSKQNDVVNNLKTAMVVYFSMHALGWCVSLGIAIACWFVSSWMVSFLGIASIASALIAVVADYAWINWAATIIGQENIRHLGQHKQSLLLDAGMWVVTLGLMVGSLVLFNATLLSSSLWLCVIATRYLLDVMRDRPVEKADAMVDANDFDPELLATGEITLSRVIATEPRHAWTNGF